MWREATSFSVVIIINKYYNKFMKTENISINYVETGWELSNEHYRRGVTWIILTAIIVGLLFVGQKIFMPQREEMAVHHFSSEMQYSLWDKSFEILENACSDNLMVRNMLLTQSALDEGKRVITKSGLKKAVPLTEMTVESKSLKMTEKVEEVTDDSEYSSGGIKESMPVFTVAGNLRNDYCVGSKIDLSHLSIKLGNTEVLLEECTIQGLDTSTPGRKTLTIVFDGYEFDIPYGVAEYRVIYDGNGGKVDVESASLYNYRFSEKELPIPEYAGKEFTGWYLDAEGTKPFEKAEVGETEIRVFAGWKDAAPYICDERGYMISCPGLNVTDGVLCLPSNPKCLGVMACALSSFGIEVSDVYIPSNILYIEPGAFDSLVGLFYIEVADDNPNYCSIEGVLYTKDGSELVSYPKGRDM